MSTAKFDDHLSRGSLIAENRRAYGMVDGPIYSDIEDPNAVLVNIIAEDMARTGQWF